MDLNIIRKFKPEYFNKLSTKEKEDVVKELILSITKEKGLTDVHIELGNGYGYDAKRNTIVIQDFNQIEENAPSSYEILTGIIHEMKHKEQADKGELDQLIYQGYGYYISPNEREAHKHASKTLAGFANVFNDDEFDIYLLKLMEEDYFKQINTLNKIKTLGYTDKSPEEYARDYSEYVSNFVCDKNPNEIGDICLLNGKYLGEVYKENGILKISDGNVMIYIKNNVAYILDIITSNEETNSQELVKGIYGILETCKMVLEDDEAVKEIHFPPDLINSGVSKEDYDMLIDAWNIKDRKISVEDIDRLQNCKSVSFKNRYKERMFEGDFSEEQQKVLDRVLEYEEIHIAIKYGIIGPEELEEMGGIGFIAKSQFKPEYSAEKLALILEAQKRNLNTSFYGKLSEEQIKEVMIAQINGVSREDVLAIVNSKDDPKKVRLRVQSQKSIKPKVKEVVLDKNFEVTFIENGVTFDLR